MPETIIVPVAGSATGNRWVSGVVTMSYELRCGTNSVDPAVLAECYNVAKELASRS